MDMKTSTELTKAENPDNNDKVTRRAFLKAGSVAATTICGCGLEKLYRLPDELNPVPHAGDTGVKVIRTACMMCNAGCGMQVKVRNGVALKIEGNPFCPHTNEYSAAGTESVLSDIPAPDTCSGAPCARGNAGLKTLYDPYRIRQPLKRTGARGEGKWQAISWKQAFEEIINGGTLPEGIFEGLKAIRGVPDSSGRASGKLGVDDTDYASEAKAGEPANFGFKANRYVWMRGRDQIPQITRRFNEAYGTVNHIEHSSLCNTNYALPAKITFSGPKAAKYSYMRVDLDNIEYLILLGTNPLEANVGTPYWARKLMAFKARGGKLIVVDPFFTHTAAKADLWIPIKEGTDLAMLMGMLRWIIDNNRYSSRYLSIPNEAAADTAGYKNYTDASFLVITSGNKSGDFLDALSAGLANGITTLAANMAAGDKVITVISTAGFPPKGFAKISDEIIYYPEKDDTANTLGTSSNGCTRGSFNTKALSLNTGSSVVVPFVVRKKDGNIALYSDADTAAPDWSGTVNGYECSTSFKLLKDQVTSKTLEEWAALCEVNANTIRAMADELSKGNKKSCVEAYRGAWSHTNGFQTSRAINILNTIIERVDRVGGYCIGKRFGGKSPAKPVSSGLTSGVRIDRAGSKYEGTRKTPTRQWYPLSSVVTQEVIPGMAAGYPYQCKALMFYIHNPAYTQSNCKGVRDALIKRKGNSYVIPLVVSCTIFMDETAALSDYILPDSTYLERYSLPFTDYPTLKTKAATIMRPVVGHYKEITIEGRPARIYVPDGGFLAGTFFDSVDTLLEAWSGPMPYDEQLIQLAKKLGLPNFGADGMGMGKNLDTACQFWNEMLSLGDFVNGLGNEGASGCPGDSAEAYMIMGGRWENPGQVEDPNAPGWAKNRYGDLISIYSEKVAHNKNALTGEAYSGIPVWEAPNRGLKGKTFDNNEYEYTVNTRKIAWHVQSRSASNEWLLELQPEGFIYINSSDAANLEVRTGDIIRVTSPNGLSVEGTVKVVNGLRRKSMVIDFHFGREWFGSKPYTVDGKESAYDPKIGRGPNANLLQSGDPDFPDVCLTDPISGQACFTAKAKIEKL